MDKKQEHPQDLDQHICRCGKRDRVWTVAGRTAFLFETLTTRKFVIFILFRLVFHAKNAYRKDVNSLQFKRTETASCMRVHEREVT